LADVFLSYARTDSAAAERSARELAKKGRSIWFDRDLPAHRVYSDVIAAELESAGAVLVLWSAAAVDSQWVRSEANRARELGKLVQARLDDIRLPMPFDQIQCADLRNWRGAGHAGWSQVLKSIDALDRREGSEPKPVRTEARPSRRNLLVGGGAIALTAAAGIDYWRTQRSHEEISPQAQLLMQKGFDALQDNDALNPEGPGSTTQAIALLSQATQAAPRAATAWGGLALAYAVRKRTVPLPERPGLDLRSRAAARQALSLDPHEGRSLGALLLLDPVYRNWLNAERADRQAVDRNSSIPLVLSITSDMLGNVGRWKDALGFSRRMDRQHFLIPGADRRFIIDLWGAGDIEDADGALQTAVEHWPGNPEIWRTRVAYLMYSGRPGEALDLLREGADRPLGISDDFVSAIRTAAGALAGTQPAQAAVSEAIGYLRKNPADALHVANASVALGAADEAFEIFDGYYFGLGKWSSVAPQGGDQDRITNALFLPPMKPVWADPRFNQLLERIGLNDYWRRSRTVPDFRRT
jgi:tetratricopeptide (TPR) repeat protein